MGGSSGLSSLAAIVEDMTGRPSMGSPLTTGVAPGVVLIDGVRRYRGRVSDFLGAGWVREFDGTGLDLPVPAESIMVAEFGGQFSILGTARAA